jgi:hypothetical protein
MKCKSLKYNGEQCSSEALINGYCNIHFRSKASNKERLEVKRYVDKKIKEMLNIDRSNI